MGTLEEIQKMRQEGMQDQQIIAQLQGKGVSYREISDAMSQSRIKAAVEGQNGENAAAAQNEPTYADDASSNANLLASQTGDLQPSIMQPQAEPAAPQEYVPASQGYANQSTYDYNAQQNYDYTGASLSTDTITEIAEQIVSERIVDIRKKMEKMSMFKTEIEAKTESLEERLKRIEKLIDTLQTAVLRKVGDYVTHVEDIKKDLALTQETFARLVPEHHKQKSHSTEHKK